MKLINVVQELQAQGYKIKFRIRTDGGIIVTQVGSKKFTSLTEGNRYVRQLSGVELSEARRVQTSYNVQKFIKLKEGQKKASSLGDTQELKNLTKKVQREWRKRKVVGEGRVTIRKVRWIAKNKGEEEAKLYLERRLSYSKGFAYDENVDYYASVIVRMGINTKYESEFQELANKLRSKKGFVKEVEHLQKIHDIWYNSGKSLGQKLQEIKAIIESI